MSAYKNFSIETDADGIALVTWDMPEKSMNVFTVEVMDELDAIIDQVVADAAIKGAVITSGKETFSGGADLTMLKRQLERFHAAVQDLPEIVDFYRMSGEIDYLLYAPDDRAGALGFGLNQTPPAPRRHFNQTLDLAKIESGRADWNACELDLKEVIEQSLAATSQLFHEKGARVEVDLPDNLPPILADRDRLIQVMLNLLSNAAKFLTPGSGHVLVRLRRLADELEVSVVDNGPGIRPEDQQLIFEKFRQVGDTMTAKPTGTGLGLPISRRIVEHLGGRLWVESVPGQGATFRFTLRLAPDREPAVVPTAAG